jgi:hypothetical protein
VDLWDELPIAAELGNGLARRAARSLCDELTGMPFIGDPSLVPVRPVVLAESVRASVNAAALRLTAIVHRVCWSLTDNPAELARRTGLGTEDVPLLNAGGIAHEVEYSGCNSRSDVLLSNGTPIFLECNFGAANGDPVSIHHLLGAYRKLYGIEPADGAPEPFHSRLEFYRRICAARELPESVAIVGTMREPDMSDVRYFEAEARYLRAHGFDSSFVEPEFFDEHRRPYSVALKHFLPGTLRYMGISLEGIARAHADTTFLVPDSGLSLSSKLVFAWLSEESVPLPDDERDFVRNHIPWTRRVEHRTVVYEEREHNLVDLAIEQREMFVVKPLNSCAGQGVLIGRNTEPDEWAKYVRIAADRQDYVIQRVVDADPLNMDFYDLTAGEISRLPVTYVLGPYVVDGVNSGIYLRHVPGRGAQVVNHTQGASTNIAL